MLTITGNGFHHRDKTLVLGNSSKPVILTGNGIQQGDVSINLVSSNGLVLSDTGLTSSSSSANIFPNDNLFNDPAVHFSVPAGQFVSGVKPPVTASLTATTISPTQVDLGWDTVQFVEISGYKIERKEETEQKWGTVVTINPESVTYSDTGLSAGTFSYRVSAVNSVGDGETSNVAMAVTVYPPDKPPSLAVTAISGTQIDLQWTAPPGSDISGYKIERSYDGLSWPSNPLVVNTGDTTTSYSDNNLLNGVLYYYRVSAINSRGNGDASENANTRTWSLPSKPTGVSVIVVSSSQIDLSWTAPTVNGGASLTGYVLENSTDNSNWDTVASVGSDKTSYSNKLLTPGILYYYRVSAVTSVGTGSPSTEEVFTRTWTVPDKPVGLTAVTVSSSQIDLEWSAPAFNGGTTIRGYQIERSLNSGEFTIIVTNTGSPVTKYSSTGLSPSEVYSYRVSTVNDVGTGNPSTGLVSATTHPGAPTDLTLTPISDTIIELSWAAPSSNGASAIAGYKIERSVNNTSNWSPIVTNTGSSLTNYSSTNLTPGTLYYYRVSTINQKGGTSSSVDASESTKARITLFSTRNETKASADLNSNPGEQSYNQFNAGEPSTLTLINLPIGYKTTSASNMNNTYVALYSVGNDGKTIGTLLGTFSFNSFANSVATYSGSVSLSTGAYYLAFQANSQEWVYGNTTYSKQSTGSRPGWSQNRSWAVFNPGSIYFVNTAGGYPMIELLGYL